MNTSIRVAPFYFVIESAGGMREGYSETTCRCVEIARTPELALTTITEIIDKWKQGHRDNHNNRVTVGQHASKGIDLSFDHAECAFGSHIKIDVVAPDLHRERGPLPEGTEEYPTLFIQAFDGAMPTDAVVVYDQQEDIVKTITNRAHAILMVTEETDEVVANLTHHSPGKGSLSEPVKSSGDTSEFNFPSPTVLDVYRQLTQCIQDLVYPCPTMYDGYDTCLHFFPVECMEQVNPRS